MSEQVVKDGEKGQKIVNIDNEDWIILKNTREGVYEIQAANLDGTIGRPSKNESLLAKWDRNTNSLIIKRAEIQFSIKATFK